MSKFNANWLRGFIDAEGCFNIHISKNSSVKLGWQTKLRFIVDQNSIDKLVLQEIGNYFGGGRLNLYSQNSAQIVISKQELIFNYIIPFFDEYPLFTKKRYDFLKWRECALIILEGGHLTQEGFNKIRNIKNYKNNNNNLPIIITELPHTWVIGFIEGDGNFYLGVHHMSNNRIKVEPRLEIGLHYKDIHILEKINKFFDYKGNMNLSGIYPHWSIRGIKNCYNILSFFDKYPLMTIKKSREYLYWKESVILTYNGVHLTEKGQKRIIELKQLLSKKNNKISNKIEI